MSRPIVPLVLLLLATLVAACSGATGAGTATAALPTPSLSATSSEPSATASAAGSSSQQPSPAADDRPLQDLLPADFADTEAHTFAVGQEMLAALAAGVGASPDDLEVAFASDHGPAFVQMFAIRIAGHEPQELLDALPEAAYPEETPDSIVVDEAQLGGRDVTVISQPEEVARLGTFYALIDGGTLIVAQTLAEEVAAAAIEALPGGGSGAGPYR
ncbi:MAG TPA: hypothetical protein VH987_02955 [Candidatus Limnocylindria bacterium]